MTSTETQTAVSVLIQVLKGRPIEVALNRACSKLMTSRVSAWVYGSCRHYFSIREQLENLSKTHPDKLDIEVIATLLIGLYQLTRTDRKPHAVVFDCVETVKQLKKRSASSLVNAVLRHANGSFSATSECGIHELPKWLISMVRSSYDQKHADEILRNINVRMPQTLRVNTRKIEVARYHEVLKQSDIAFSTVDTGKTIWLENPQPTATLPGYLDGWFSVQDASSQLPVGSLDLKHGMRVLDACSAPGNKSFQILEDDVQLVALDLDETRSQWSVLEGKRLGSPLVIELADATQLDWWDGIHFDRILIDAPCSATGTIARRPDVKIHRSPEQLESLGRKQFNLIHNLLTTLKDDGVLVYCTCSILPCENDAVVGKILNAVDGVHVEPIRLTQAAKNHAITQQYGTTIIPHSDWGDGFYMAKLRRTSSPT